MKRALPLIAAAGALLSLPAIARAQDQPWLADRRYTEGIGVRVGDFELHPGAAVEFGYDSNFFHRSSEENPVQSLRLRVTPSFSFATLGQQRRAGSGGGPPPDFEFRGGISLTYNEFFPVSGNITEREIMRDQRNVGGLVDLTLNILPGQPWSGTIFGDVGRNITASNQGITGASFNRINARAGAEIAWTPGSGLLDWRLGYRFAGTIFEAAQYGELTNVENTIQTRGRWRFLPRTALMYDAKIGFVTYPAGSSKTDSHPLRAQLGLNGLITPSFGILALAGWGASFYSGSGQVEDFDSIIGQLEVKWYITPNPSADPAGAGMSLSAVSVGFLRDFQDSYIGTYFERDRGYINLTYLFAGRFLVAVEGGVGPQIYPTVTQPVEIPGGFTNVRVDASLFGEYRFKDRFGINATLRYGANLNNQVIQVPADEPGVTVEPDYLGYQKFEAYLGARWFM
jgi:hypothetical protein